MDKVLNEYGIAVNTTDPRVPGIMFLFRCFNNLQRHPILVSSNLFQMCKMVTKKRVQIIHFQGTDTNMAIIREVFFTLKQLTILYDAVRRVKN